MLSPKALCSAFALAVLTASGCQVTNTGNGSIRVVNATSHANIDVDYVSSTDAKHVDVASNLAVGALGPDHTFPQGDGTMTVFPTGSTNKVMQKNVIVPSKDVPATIVLFGKASAVDVIQSADLTARVANCVIQVWDAVSPSGTYDAYILAPGETVASSLPVNSIAIDTGNRVTTRERFLSNPDKVDFAPDDYTVALTNRGSKAIVAQTLLTGTSVGNRYQVVFSNASGSISAFIVKLP